jgi:RNA recognition motif-containing protein
MVSKLYVGGLPYSTTSEGLRQHFARCGAVVSATVVTDRISGQARGFGFVEMSTEAEAKAAIELLNGQMLEGRRLKVELAQGSRSGGSRSGGFGGGRVRTARW